MDHASVNFETSNVVDDSDSDTDLENDETGEKSPKRQKLDGISEDDDVVSKNLSGSDSEGSISSGGSGSTDESDSSDNSS